MNWKDRPVGDLLVLMITFTVCFTIMASGALVAILSLWRPGVDVSLWVNRVTSVVNTMIGLLAGYLAGRSDRVMRPMNGKSTEDPES